jgi:hypothetical protein
MSKMGSHDPFGHLKHKLWPNEGPRVKLPIWLPTIKSQESPKFLACMWHATYCWKALNKGYNFAENFISIKGLHTKLWAHKVVRISVVRISGLALGSPRTKCHLDVGLVERHKVYYKGEGGGFPQIRAVVSLVSQNYPWLVLAPKVLQLCTNHFVFGFVQVHVSSWCFSLILVPYRSSNMPLYPESVANQGACPDSLLFQCFHFKLTFESIKGLGITSNIMYIWNKGLDRPSIIPWYLQKKHIIQFKNQFSLVYDHNLTTILLFIHHDSCA